MPPVWEWGLSGGRYETKMNAPKPWDRQPRETPKAFQAWEHYRDAGPERSTRKTARALKKDPSLIAQWSSRWNWQARLLAFDAYNAEREREAIGDAMRREADKWAKRENSLRETRWNEAERLTRKAGEILNARIQKGRHNPGDAARLIETADKLRALSLGQPTSKQEIVGPDNSPVAATIGQVIVYLPDNGRGVKGEA